MVYQSESAKSIKLTSAEQSWYVKIGFCRQQRALSSFFDGKEGVGRVLATGAL